MAEKIAAPKGFEILDTRTWLSAREASEMFGAILESGMASPACFGVGINGAILDGVIYDGQWRKRRVPAPRGRFSAAVTFAARMIPRLKGVLSAEESGIKTLLLEGIQMHYNLGTYPIARVRGFHEDQGGYLRVLTSLLGDGVLYQDERGRERRLAEGETLVMTTLKRRSVCGGRIAATRHCSPATMGPRLLLILDVVPP